jgi:hypothetical protein
MTSPVPAQHLFELSPSVESEKNKISLQYNYYLISFIIVENNNFL